MFCESRIFPFWIRHPSFFYTQVFLRLCVQTGGVAIKKMLVPINKIFVGLILFFKRRMLEFRVSMSFFFCLAQMMYPSFTVQARYLFRVTCKYPSINICCLQKLDSTDLDRPWTAGTYVNKTNIQCNGATQTCSLFSQMKSLQA